MFQEVRPGESVGQDEEVRVMIDAVLVYAPAERISGNQRFWDVVTPWSRTADQQRLLDANGIRVGVMSTSDWPRVRQIMEESPAVISQMATITGPIQGTLDTRDVTRTTVFYYDKRFDLQGRTIDDSESHWGLFFSPEPTNKNTVALEVSPVIRSKRREMKPVRVGDDLQIDYIQPETIYDLGIKTQLPLGSVLVLAPSAGAIASPSGLGYVFLMKDEETTISERVIFLYPRAYRFSAKATDEAARQSGGDAGKPSRPALIPKVQ